MDEMIILAMLLCVGLGGLGLRMRMWPIAFVSSIGWVIIACELFEQSRSWLVLGLMIMVAFSQIILVRDSEGRR